MSISPPMQVKLNRIDELINNGHTLTKAWGYYPDLKNSSGKSVNIFGGVFSFSSPAGFSWIAFFFPWAVCAQIKEWSYFYFVAVFSVVSSILGLLFDTSTNISGFLTCFFYGYMYPYLRHMALKANVKEYSKGVSILVGFALTLVALLPAAILGNLTL